MPEKQPIGKVSASEKYPTTVDEFYFWIQDDTLVRPFDIVKVEHYHESVTYGVIEEITHITDSPGHIGSYVSSDFGDVNSKPETLRLGLSFAKCKVSSNHPQNGIDTDQIYMPIRDGSSVYFADDNEIIEALGLKHIKNPIPAGFIETSNASVPICFNRDFRIGPEGAHLNISGISGLATKTSYAMFLLQALQQKEKDIVFIILNVKATDLLRLDEENPKLDDKDKRDYDKSELTCKPFEEVTYFYPYQKKDKTKFYSNTYLPGEVLEVQHNRDKAFNYIYTYEKDRENLDLLFSNIEDQNKTMESILNEVIENPEFDNLTWETFMGEVKEYTKKGHTKNKEIPIASWRKFSRLIHKSVTNDIFQGCPGGKDKKHKRLRDEISNIKSGSVFVIDIAKLDEQLQCFVFGDIVQAVYDLKLGETERDEKDIPKRIVIFVDELNKYASSSAPKNSPILNSILEIAERGRSMGVILFSAEQFRSAIHDRATGNCSTHAYGRTNAIEISKPDYRLAIAN